MDQFKAVILIFIITQPVFATNLCDSGCDLQISFPDGGTIEATEPLTLFFGSNGNLSLGETGTINNAIQPASLDYSSGGSLSLAAGESIQFDINGSLTLGDYGGNINYTRISIQGSFIADITAIEGTQSIYLSQLTLTGDSTFNLSAQNIEISNIDSIGSLTINGDENSEFSILGPINAYSLEISGGASSDLFIIGDISSASLDTSNTLGNGNLISSSSVYLSTNQPISATTEPVLLNTADTFDLTNWNISTAAIPPSESNLSPANQITVNGQSCSLSFAEDAPQCETNDGTIYQFIDGEWVEVESAGVLSALNLVLISLFLGFRRKFKQKRIFNHHQIDNHA